LDHSLSFAKMVKLNIVTVAAAMALAALLPAVQAHPGHSVEEEIAERAAYLKRSVTNLDHCAEKLRARGVEKRSLNRRVAKIQELRDEVKQRKSMLHTETVPDVEVDLQPGSMMPRQATDSAMASGSSVPTGAMPSGAAPSGASSNGTGGGGGADSGQNISDFGATVANTSHLSTLDVDPWTSDVESIIYGNSSCILNPEGEVGPYCKAIQSMSKANGYS
jgi:hypothetical protein